MNVKSCAILLLLMGLAPVAAGDWPMYGGNAGRSGFSEEKLTTPLALAWTYKPLHPPMPAWPSSDRQPFDRYAHPVIVGNTLFFGSSADDRVHALDVQTGQERWTFFTDGPVRFAPALGKDRVLVASDDGHLYCLGCTDGKLYWKHRGGPRDEMILGNDRLISRWPARGGPVIVGDTVYYGAGIWPTEGIYLHALSIVTGKVVWTNENSGGIYMGQPHGGANAYSGVSAQGYLVATDEDLLVPTGRAVPAVFNRADGKFKYFHLQQFGQKGGTNTLAAGSLFVNAGLSFDLKTGDLGDPVGKGPIAVAGQELLCCDAKGLTAYQFANKEKVDRKGKSQKYRGLEKKWTMPGVAGGTSLIVAGQTAISGGDKQLAMVDLSSKKVVWSATVDGVAGGLAAADGRLFVSTDQGTLYCFSAKSVDKPREIRPQIDPAPYGKAEVETAQGKSTLADFADQLLARAAQSAKTESHAGYCVDLGCGDGALTYELARKSKLHIYAIDSDPKNVAEARRKLAAAGLYGVRVTVHQGDPEKTPYPKYFANLVVSGRSVKQGPPEEMPKEVLRLQRPFGGVAALGPPLALRIKARGPLMGAGSWTHQYADPANTCCSGDSLVKGTLGMLWFRDSDFPMPQRHGRGPAPLYHEGRLIVEGLHGLRAVDAYNGRLLWEFPLKDILKPYNGEHLMGTAGTGSNYCLTGDGVYVATGNVCLRIDPATGKKLGEFPAPEKGTWGYIACEKGMLFGSLVNDKHVVKYAYGKADMSQQFTESRLFFALDALTGKLKWSFTPKHSLRHNAITLGDGRVFLIDRPVAEIDRLGAPKNLGKEHAKGVLLALDQIKGKVLWQKEDNIYGTLLALSAAHDVLLMSYQSTRFKLPSEEGKWLTGFQASTGQRLWEKTGIYITRPILVDRTIYTQGGAWDILDGGDKPFPFKRSYGCGQITASQSLMVFRSATLGIYDLVKNQGMEDYGGIRRGCWINSIPAGGIVLVPDATAGCQCSYLNQAWIALQTMQE